MIDNLFFLVINRSNQISNEFLDLIKRLEFNYTKEMLNIFAKDKLQMIKEIIYVLYSIANDNMLNILIKAQHKELINLYNNCKNMKVNDFLAYYKKSIINKYTNNST